MVVVNKEGFVLKLINLVLSKGLSPLIIKNKGFIGFGTFLPSFILTINLSKETGIPFFNSGIASNSSKLFFSFVVFVFMVKLFILLLVIILVILSSFDFDVFFSLFDLNSIFDIFILSVKKVPPS